MPQTSGFARARMVALAVPLLLLGGAYVAQYGFGLPPCEMCWWQRYPHFAAIVLAGLAFIRPNRALVALAGLALAVSGLIGGFHAGVEYHWWEGLTACSTTATDSGDPLAAIMNAPIVRCDVAAWTLIGISLAGWNFLLSLGSAFAVWGLLARNRKSLR